MRFNYSFCIAFLLLAHMSTAVPLTGVDNGEEFTGNKILPSSLEKTSEAKPENAVKSETLRSKRGYDYSDYSSESSEEYFGYFNKPHHYHFNTHWPNNPYHRLPPTPPTEAYVFWRPASSRSPYYHGKYHNHQHDKKCKFPFYGNGGYDVFDSNEQTEYPEISTAKELSDNVNNIWPSSTTEGIPITKTSSTTTEAIPITTTSSTTTESIPITSTSSTTTESIPSTSSTTTESIPITTTTEIIPLIDIRSGE